jgi:hypothetical protein
MPLQLRDKSDFIPKLTVNANIFKSNLFNTYSFSCNPPETRSDPNPRPSFPQAQIFNGGSKSSCSGKSHPLKVHSATPTSDFFSRLFLIGAFHRAFDSHRGQLNILFPRSCGNFWSPWVHWSRIQENPFQSGFIRASSVARRFQELAFTPNRRLGKLV